MRTCKECKEEKPLVNFVKHPECKEGRRPICKKCNWVAYERAHSLRNYYKDIEKSRAKSRYYNKKRKVYFKEYRQTEEHKSIQEDYFARYRQTEKYKETHKRATANYIRAYPERQYARELAQKYIELKPACEECGTEDKRLHRHHPDYSKPLEVISLCQPCHERKHHAY